MRSNGGVGRAERPPASVASAAGVFRLRQEYVNFGRDFTRFLTTGRRALVVLGLGLGGLTGASQTDAEDVLAEMRACAAEPDDAQRLDCYDTHMRRTPDQGRTTDASRQPPHAKAENGAAAATAAAAEQQFGMNEQLARKSRHTEARPRIDKLRARVAAVSRKPRGEPIVTLENGQVWETVDGEGAIELKAGDVVTIWPGLFGAFRLSAGSSVVRVSRIR
jgi:hypothetical protein